LKTLLDLIKLKLFLALNFIFADVLHVLSFLINHIPFSISAVKSGSIAQ